MRDDLFLREPGSEECADVVSPYGTVAVALPVDDQVLDMPLAKKALERSFWPELPVASPSKRRRAPAKPRLPHRPEPAILDKYAKLWTQSQLDAYGRSCYEAGVNAGAKAAGDTDKPQ